LIFIAEVVAMPCNAYADNGAGKSSASRSAAWNTAIGRLIIPIAATIGMTNRAQPA
jgi:hypothetical protein